MSDFNKVNRVEVIDNNGRSYVFDPRAHPGAKVHVRLSMQDQDRTLKVFVEWNDPITPPPEGTPR